MDFSEKIAELTKKVRNIGDTLGTEEATKNALVMPFIAALGYDVFNPGEVVPEWSLRNSVATVAIPLVNGFFRARNMVSYCHIQYWPGVGKQ